MKNKKKDKKRCLGNCNRLPVMTPEGPMVFCDFCERVIIKIKK